MNPLKAFMQDYPTQGGGVVIAHILIFLTGLVVIVRLALGATFPAGYDAWLMFLGALAGIATGGMIGKRATDHELARIKSHGPSQVSVASPSQVTVESKEKG
jgi:H+/Cl- antiporter ClcA